MIVEVKNVLIGVLVYDYYFIQCIAQTILWYRYIDANAFHFKRLGCLYLTIQFWSLLIGAKTYVGILFCFFFILNIVNEP